MARYKKNHLVDHAVDLDALLGDEERLLESEGSSSCSCRTVMYFGVRKNLGTESCIP
jgi:hypothetical protein